MMMGERNRKGREYPGPVPPSILIRCKSPNSGNPERLILENRRKEDALDEMRRLVKKTRHNELTIDWLRHADRLAMFGDIEKKIQRRLGVHEFTVDQRRDRLRALLQQEEQQNIEDMEEKEETILERQAKMRARIKTLREQKEEHRREIVQEKYDQQFREQCDELRSCLSKRQQDMVCAERAGQLRQKEMDRQREREEKDMWDTLWEQDRQLKMAREAKEAQDAAERNREFFHTLQTQRAALDDQKREQQTLREEEKQLMKEQEALRKAEDQAAKQEKRRRQQETRYLLDLSIQTKLRNKAREEQEQLAFELKMMEQLLEETKCEQREREQRKLELRAEDRKYREYLSHMLEEEKKKQREVEDLIQRTVDVDYQKMVDKWRKDARMRKTLLKDVMEGRRQQIEHRLAENRRHKAELARAHEEFVQLLEEERQEDERFARKRRQTNVRHQDHLRQQMRLKDTLTQEDRDWRRYEHQMGLQADREYQARLKQVLDHPEIPRLHPFRRAQASKEAKDNAGDARDTAAPFRRAQASEEAKGNAKNEHQEGHQAEKENQARLKQVLDRPEIPRLHPFRRALASKEAKDNAGHARDTADSALMDLNALVLKA